MKLQKKVEGLLQDIENSLEIQQFVMQKALDTCKKLQEMVKILNSKLGEENESSSS